MKLKLSLIYSSLTLLLILSNCQGTGLSPAPGSASIPNQPYSSYTSSDSNLGSAEVRMNVKIKKNLQFSNIWLDIAKVEVRVKPSSTDSGSTTSSTNNSTNTTQSYANSSFFKLLESSSTKSSSHTFSEGNNNNGNNGDNGSTSSDDDGQWIDLTVPPMKLDVILFARHQLVLTAGAYNLTPNIYDRVRITLGTQSSVVISGQSYPLSVDSENSDNVIIVKGDIEVLDHKLTGAVLNFDPSDDIHRSNNDSSNHNNSTSSNNSNHSNDGNNDNSTVTYKMKKEFQVQQSAVLGTNFPVSSTDYTMLTNVTLNKTEVCMEEELRIDTSFVYPNGIPGGVSVNVGGSSGGDSVIVVFYETGLKLVPVTVSDYNHNTESINIPVMVNDCTKPGIVRIQEVPNNEDAGHTFFAQTPDMAAPITY